MIHQFSRTEFLLGSQAMECLYRARVAVFGQGDGARGLAGLDGAGQGAGGVHGYVERGGVERGCAGGAHCGAQRGHVGGGDGVGPGRCGVIVAGIVGQLLHGSLVGLHVLCGIGLVQIHEAEENHGHEGEPGESVAIHYLW